MIVIVFDDAGNLSRWVYLTGSNAWTLMKLLTAGDVGCGPDDRQGANFPAYVQNLREMGFDIEISRMPQTGAFPELDVRYFLRSKIIIMEAMQDAG